MEDEVRGAVRFARATAYDREPGAPVVSIHGFVDRQDLAEADQVVELIHQTRQARADDSIAVLVRSRNHLAAIVAALKKAGLAYQAQDIDPLSERPVVQDLLSLARALQHPADRVAWLAVLRAPWCGLTLDDLNRLCSRDARATIWQLMTNPAEQAEMFDQLSPDGRQRLNRILPVLDRALKNRGRLNLQRLVESTWLALNGPACVGEADLLDVRQVFTLLAELGDDSMDKFEEQLAKLFAAPDPQAGPELQLMTIHKAKGLEFDTVILPGLGRGVRSRERALLRWLEHPDYELLLAPIPPLQSDQQEPTYQAIGTILQEKDDLETLRLLYVAVTRAKSRLHLLGHVRLNRDGQMSPTPGSLLSVAWPAWHAEFSAHAVVSTNTQTEEKVPPKLCRLPLWWRPPQLAERLVVIESTVRRASAAGHYEENLLRSRRTEEGKVVGTLVHLWLERIASDGPGHWSAADIQGLSGRLRGQLSVQGVPAARLETCSSLILDCLTRTVSSERGRWLLADHREAASELPLNGVIDGQLIHATIDRTFVDDDGLRWVVDYKTSAPAPGEGPDQFMAREVERYGSQLQLYATLLRLLMPEGPRLRAGLYFPVVDGWVEVEV
jgi:ATP-dependent exoDNAse (exonuclease V) beta subunit